MIHINGTGVVQVEQHYSVVLLKQMAHSYVCHLGLQIRNNPAKPGTCLGLIEHIGEIQSLGNFMQYGHLWRKCTQNYQHFLWT